MRRHKPGHRPEGNEACVEVVETSALLPDDVIWGEDRWYCVLDAAENDMTKVVAAPIIDDAAGQDESLILYGETFLRVVVASDHEREVNAEAREDVRGVLDELAGEAARQPYLDDDVRSVVTHWRDRALRAERALGEAKPAGGEVPRA